MIAMGASSEEIARHMRQLFDTGSAAGLTDGELLARFACRRAESESNPESASTEAAFETLLARHGSMVLSVCRQLLGDLHAADDAFQATFLVLIRRSGSFKVRECDSLGPWLYGVAYRTAIKARRLAARRLAREHRAAVSTASACDSRAEVGELRSLLHEEVSRLPAKYRAPVVLCYFEGRTHDEAAAALHWPVGTVRGRLARARDLLRSRLTRRGLAPAAVIGASTLEQSTRANVSASLRDATVATAIKGALAGGSVAALTKIMLRTLVIARLKTSAVLVLTIALLGTSAGTVVRKALAVQPLRKTNSATLQANAQQAQPRNAGRSITDPLPKYARARLGNSQFHNGDSVNQVL
jgi:RNA polymerase sigma factor (sigma-70 family)